MNIESRPIRTAAETGLLQVFEGSRERLRGLDDARDDAIRTIAAGLPHRRVEDWKYTDLRALMREAKPLASPPDAGTIGLAAENLPLAEVDAFRCVLVNGAFSDRLSDLSGLPEGVTAISFGQALASHHPLLGRLASAGAPAEDAAVALATAFASDGLVLHVQAGVVVERPIHLVSLQEGTGHAAYSRALVVVDEGASVTLIESHLGGEAHQTASLVEMLVGDGARVTHVKMQAEALSTQHLATLALRLGAGVEFSSLAIARGAAVARQQVFASFDGADSKAALRGVTLAGGRRHLDTTLVIEHHGTGCESREHYKAVLEGEARSVFQGRIIVRHEAQKTDGRMMTQALLLSEGTEADLKPELEIYADDVQCAHGATAGALDDEYLFYLRARGIPQPEAESILVHAFIGEVLDTIEHEKLRDALTDVAEAWLAVRD